MFQANALIEKAQTSKFYLKMLNFALSRLIPFNKPHGFKISSIEDDAVKVALPYRKSNLNHLKGLHACALATVSEFATGLMLMRKLEQGKYRIILKNLQVDYHYQGKMGAYAFYNLTDQWLNQNVIEPLASQDAILVNCEVKVSDKSGNHLSTAKVLWQIKQWGSVKTRVN